MISKQSRSCLSPNAFLAIALVWLCITAFPPTAAAQGGYYRIVQTGYAIITPTTPGGADLLVFETLGILRNDGSTQAGAVPAGMTFSAMLVVNANVNLLSELAVAVANPGSEDAFVTLTLRREDGTAIATKGMMVGALRQRARFLAEMFPSEAELAVPLTGTLLISSNVPVSITGLRFHNWSFSPVPVTNLGGPMEVPMRDPGVGGPDAVLVPYFAVGEGWDTGLFIANLGSTPLTIRVDLYLQNGAPMIVGNWESGNSMANLFIPPGGVITLNPSAPYSVLQVNSPRK